LVTIFAFVLNFSLFEFLVAAIMIVLVISAEMINSSIEEVVNLLVSEHRKEAKIAKDVAAGMVLLISVFALAVGIILFLPHIFVLFN
jgi:undecaprenol kinase